MTNGTKRYLDTIEWLGKLFDFVNDQFYDGELVRPVITVQNDEKNRCYGWYTLKKVWKENEEDEGEHEINMSAQFLNRPAKEVAETLMHESCHHYAKLKNIQDCSRSGTYHNKLFKKIAETHGLKVEYVPTIGWSKTSLTEEAEELLQVFLEYHPANLIYRTPVLKGQRVKTSSTRKYICPCCGQSVRATKTVNIMCGDCDKYMKEEW